MGRGPATTPWKAAPVDPALDGHLTRTAALAGEVAAGLGMPPALGPVLEHAVWLHHAPLHLLEEVVPDPELMGDVREVLFDYHGGFAASNPGPAHVTLAGILRTCDLLDQKLEAIPSSGETFDEALRELWAMVPAGQALAEAVAAIEVWSADILSDFADLPGRLTVSPEAARQVRRLLTVDRHHDVAHLHDIAKKDPVLAASVVRLANSSLFSPSMPITRLAAAVSFIGPRNARNAMIAAVLRPLCVSAGLSGLWAHSLEMARYAEALAARTGIVDCEEAFLLGLMHDVGRVAIQHFPKGLVERQTHLVELGCPPTYSEQCVFRCDHSQIGEEVLKIWGFPESFREAVRHHHQPEQSDSLLAPFLYLAEYGTGSEEGIASAGRVRLCSERTGISTGLLQTVTPAERSLATALAIQA